MKNYGDKYLTTKDLAELLHVRERKIYDLASAGDIPCTRALGKLLFERTAIDAWLAGHGSEGTGRRIIDPANVFLGSHEPFLERCLRESDSGLATFFDGSRDGLERFAKGEGVATGIHIYCADENEWNVPVIAQQFADKPAVLIEWAWRERGLVVPKGNPKKVKGIETLPGLKMVPRQSHSGTQILLEHYLDKLGDGAKKIKFAKPARTESDAVLAVMEGTVDVAFGLKSLANQYRLDFIPLTRERFDLLVWWREWFEAPLQNLMRFVASDEFSEMSKGLDGYDFSGIGTVHFNGRPQLVA